MNNREICNYRVFFDEFLNKLVFRLVNFQNLFISREFVSHPLENSDNSIRSIHIFSNLILKKYSKILKNLKKKQLYFVSR